MPAGDLITADFQVELQGVLMGNGAISIAERQLSGLGNPSAKTADVDLANATGAYGSPDYLPARVITIPMSVQATTPSGAWNLFRSLVTAWSPVAADVQMHVRLPGLGHVYYSGRPRALSDDLSDLYLGWIYCLGTFVALNPVSTYAASPPTIGAATAGVGSATANWTAPATEASDITGYRVVTYRATDNVVLFTDDVGVVLTFTRTGLAATVGVYFKVAANRGGNLSAQTAASNTVTPT